MPNAIRRRLAARAVRWTVIDGCGDLTMVQVVLGVREEVTGGWGAVVIDRLSVLCFAGTYGLAFLAEVARFAVRSTVRWYVAAGLMALGWLVQTAFLANLALKSPLVLVDHSV